MNRHLLPPPAELKQIAYRVAPLPKNAARPSRPLGVWPGMALILETARSESLAGAARLGCYLLVQGERVLARGLFYGPAVTAADRQVLATVTRRFELADKPLSLEDLRDLLFRHACRYRQALLGFDLAAQLASLAADWTAPAAEGLFAGGVSLVLWTTDRRGSGKRKLLRTGGYENGYRPRLLCKMLADGSAALAFTGRRDPDRTDRVPEGHGAPRLRYVSPGRVLPLERFARALTGVRARSLREACEAAGIDPPPGLEITEPFDPDQAATRCLERADAAHQLYLRLLERHRALGLAIPPDRVFSPASYAKATYDAIGITPPMQRYDGDLLGIGAATCAAYGGWSGVGIRSLPESSPLPVRLTDVAGEYPVCAHSLGIWKLLTSDRLSLEPTDPAEIERWISQQRWKTIRLSPELCVLCRVRPNGDVLPHRIQPGASWLTTVAPLRYEPALWWPLPDLVTSFFETGVVPKIEAALRLAGAGCLSGLRSIELPGLGLFDPADQRADLFLFLAEGRQRLEHGETEVHESQRAPLAALYKEWDNTACSGIFLEVPPTGTDEAPTQGDRGRDPTGLTRLGRTPSRNRAAGSSRLSTALSPPPAASSSLSECRKSKPPAEASSTSTPTR